MSAPESTSDGPLPTAPGGPDTMASGGPEATAPSSATPEPDDTDVSGRQRAGWGSAAEPAYDRRQGDRRRGDRRGHVRRADDRWHVAAVETRPSEPPPLRVPSSTTGGGPMEGAMGAGRVLGLLLVILIAFAGGVAVDQAAWRSPASQAVVTPVSTTVARPPATAAPGASAAPTASPAPGITAQGPTPAPSPTVTPGPTIGPGASVPPNAPANINVLWEALKTIQEHWVRRSDLNPNDLTYGMINGLVDSLGDPGHTVFLTPEQVKSENDALSGHITGIGVFLSTAGGAPSVQSVVSGSPAQKAGILPGDEILAIDGTSAENLSVEEIAKLVRGPVGTQVTLTVLHPGAAAPVDIPITRAEITVPPVSWTMLPGTSIADIRISQFSNGTADQFITALRGARQAGAKGIVLDLRNNPGGYVDEAVGVVSQLLKEGNVYVRKTADGTEIPVPIRGTGVATDIPISILVDYGSASSSEITAGALQDAKRGQVIGTRTYGTGTVLNTFGLSDGSAIRLGVEEWLTPSRRAIFPNGITPDQEVNLDAGARALEPDQIRSMTADALRASGDAQLLRAMEALTNP